MARPGTAGTQGTTSVNGRASRAGWNPPPWNEQLEQWEESLTIMRVGFLRATSDVLRAALAVTETHLHRVESGAPEIPFEKIFPDDDGDEAAPADPSS
jgi:hypothetical protein